MAGLLYVCMVSDLMIGELKEYDVMMPNKLRPGIVKQHWTQICTQASAVTHDYSQWPVDKCHLKSTCPSWDLVFIQNLNSEGQKDSFTCPATQGLALVKYNKKYFEPQFLREKKGNLLVKYSYASWVKVKVHGLGLYIYTIFYLP